MHTHRTSRIIRTLCALALSVALVPTGVAAAADNTDAVSAAKGAFTLPGTSDSLKRFELAAARARAQKAAATAPGTRTPLVLATANNIPGTPIPASGFGGYVDYFADTDWIDVYSVYLAAGQTFRVTVTAPPAADIEPMIFSPLATDINYNAPVIMTDPATPNALAFTASAPGTYYLGVASFYDPASYTVNYTIDNSVITTPADDLNDLPGVPAPASPITDSLDSALAAPLNEHVYRVTLVEGETLTMSLTSPAGADFDLYVLDDNAMWKRSLKPTGETDSYTFTAPYDGDYYMVVQAPADSGAGSYQLDWYGSFYHSTPTVARLGGIDRYEVAANVASTAFPGYAGVTDVVVACGEDRAMADPLSAAGLAGAVHGPVLLVRSYLLYGKLPGATESVLTAIKNANGGKVNITVVGGTGSVPAIVYNRLSLFKGTGTITRINGANRYDLAAQIASKVVAKVGIDNVRLVLLANGENPAAFYDALAASPISYATHSPLLLTRAATLDPSANYLLAGVFSSKPKVVVNSAGYLTSGVFSAAKANYRLSDTTNRFDSAMEIGDEAISRGWLTDSAVGVANKLPDALTGGSAIGQLGGVIDYTDATVLNGTTEVGLFIDKASLARVFVLGGTGSVNGTVYSDIASALK